MPTYEYACRDCGHHLEVVQSFRDAPLTACGVCGGGLRKVFSPAGLIFKGSGYYVNDSRKQPKEGTSTSSGDGAEGKTSGDKKKASDAASTSGSGSGSAKGGAAESA